MRVLFISLFCIQLQMGHAQPGFNVGQDFNYYFNLFFDTAVNNDTIISYGITQDTLWPYVQCILVARFDTVGNFIDHRLIKDPDNKIYTSDKHWGKLIHTKDGGFALTTIILQNGHAVFVKLSRSLEVEFTQVFVDTINHSEFLVEPIEVPDGYLLYGYFQRAENYKLDAILRKVDKQGNPLWRKNFGELNWYEFFRQATPYQDSLILLNGFRTFNPDDAGSLRPWVTVINQSGDVKWQWTTNSLLPYQGIHPGWFFPQPDGTWLCFGGKNLEDDPVNNWPRYQNHWTKLDSAFNFVWTKPFGPNIVSADIFYEVLQLPDQNFIGIGERGSFTLTPPEAYERKGWVMRFDAQADSVWEWTGKMPAIDPGAHFFSGGALLSSGSIIAAGRGEDQSGRGYCWLVKISPDGCVDTLFCNPQVSVVPEIEREGGAISVFPNPATEVLNIRLPESLETAVLSVTNPSGQEVLFKTVSTHAGIVSIPVSELPTGVYFLKVQVKGGLVYGQRFVVQR